MGLDIYTGTLTRYYTQNWKTATQQFAEAHGIQFQTVRFQQEQENGQSIEEIKEIVTEWRDNIISGLKLDPAPLWNEDYDTTPYYTNKPDWDALHALMLYAVAKFSSQEVPATIEKNFDVYRHPIVEEFLKSTEFNLTFFNENGWWLPMRHSRQNPWRNLPFLFYGKQQSFPLNMAPLCYMTTKTDGQIPSTRYAEPKRLEQTSRFLF